MCKWAFKIFGKDKVAQNISDILGYFLEEQFILLSHPTPPLNKQCQKWIVVNILRFQKSFDVYVFRLSNLDLM